MAQTERLIAKKNIPGHAKKGEPFTATKKWAKIFRGLGMADDDAGHAPAPVAPAAPRYQTRVVTPQTTERGNPVGAITSEAVTPKRRYRRRDMAASEE